MRGLSCGMRTLSCSAWDPVACEGWCAGPRRWELGVLATRPAGEPLWASGCSSGLQLDWRGSVGLVRCHVTGTVVSDP